MKIKYFALKCLFNIYLNYKLESVTQCAAGLEQPAN